MKRLKSSNDGYIVLITVIILGVVAMTIAGFLLLTASNASDATLSVKGNIESKAGATACAELALAAIKADPTLTTPASGSSTIDTNTHESCTYAITGTTPSYTISASGFIDQTHANYSHNLSITVSAVSPKIVVSSWEDTP